MKMRKSERGFALPTVVLASVILMVLLAGSLSIASSNSAALREQYNAQLMREAAEAGLRYAEACYLQVESTATSGQWPNTGTLETGENCYGAPKAGANCGTASATAACYVVMDSNIRSRFSVSVTVDPAAPTVISLAANGVTDRTRTSDRAVISTSQTSLRSNFSIDLYGMASGNDTTCAVIDGKLYCWGLNNSGQVGIGTTTNVTKPTLVQGALVGKYVHAVATGIDHTCALTGPAPVPSAATFPSTTISTKVYCWGKNDQGQLGNAAWTASTSPSDARVLNFSSKYGIAISARDHNCVITKEISNPAIRYTYCWGDNNQKQAGKSTECTTADNTGTQNPKPAFGCPIAWNNASNLYIDTTVQISAVTNGNACGVAAQESNIVWCIGNSDQAGLGNGGLTDTDTPRAVRVRVDADTYFSGASKVALNNGRGCALSTYGSPAGIRKLWCWGPNYDYVTGKVDWRIDARFTTTKVSYATQMQRSRADTTYQFYDKDVSDFAISDWNTCFIHAGEVYCAGYNNLGQLGVGNTTGGDGQPSPAPGNATSASQIRAIEWAVKVQGALTGKTVVGIVGGNDHFCARTTENEMYCWGSNEFGQLGTGNTTNALSPVRIAVPKTIIY